LVHFNCDVSFLIRQDNEKMHIIQKKRLQFIAYGKKRLQEKFDYYWQKTLKNRMIW